MGLKLYGFQEKQKVVHYLQKVIWPCHLNSKTRGNWIKAKKSENMVECLIMHMVQNSKGLNQFKLMTVKGKEENKAGQPVCKEI